MICPEDKNLIDPDRVPESKQNIVLDIDENIVHTFEDNTSPVLSQLFELPDEMELRKRIYIIQFEKGEWMWGIQRNYLQTFLDYCEKRFKRIIVWTAGTKEYAERVTNVIFSGRKAPYKVYSREDCVVYGKSYIKPLSKITDSEVTLENTIFLDDNKFYMQKNVGNAIITPAFSPEASLQGLKVCDIALLQVISWAGRSEVLAASDIRHVQSKEFIFAEQIF